MRPSAGPDQFDAVVRHRIEFGERADLIVLDGAPFAAKQDLADLVVRATMVDSTLVYDTASAGG